MNRSERIVVVGAGLAGLRAAERLRELGFDGELVIVGGERTPPYHRPALSKQLLTGAMRPNELMFPAYQDVAAKWRLGTSAQYLLPRSRTLRLPGAEEITYDGLIIATGVEARRQSGLPYHDKRVVVLRTLADALELERVLGTNRGRVVVIGGGFTGCEVAASLRHLGREVTLVGRQPTLLGNVLGPQLGDWLTDLHRDHGVDLALGTSVRQWQPGPDGVGMHLADGTALTAACVVVATGTTPSTAWLRGSGLPLDDGVVCDATCHVVGAEDVVAAGDVAQWPNVRFDTEPRRVEHWLNAVEMGRAAAESLLAGRSAAEPFTPMPRFWTEQYGVRIQAAGVPKLGTENVALGTPHDGTGTVVGYAKDRRLMGVVGVDCPSSVLAWTESVCRQNPVPRTKKVVAARSQADAGLWTERAAPMVTAVGTASGGPAARPAARRLGRHSLPAPAGPAAASGAPRSGGAGREVGWVGGSEPVGSSGRVPPVGGPAGSSGRMPPVGQPGPVESSGPMMPVGGPPPGPAGSNGRMRPAALAGYGPAGSSGRMAPVGGPAASNGRMRPAAPAGYGPTGSNGRMAPVDPGVPVRPVGADGGPGPVDSGGRIMPVGPDGRLGRPVGGELATEVTGQIAPIDPGPVRSNGHSPNGHSVNGHTRLRSVSAGRQVAPQDPYEERSLIAQRLGPADSYDRTPPVGRPGPEDSYDRMPPVPPRGPLGPVDSNGRLRPVRFRTAGGRR